MNKEIYHFGIKGMKWGVRKKREKSNRPKSNKQILLENKYKKKGLSKEEAEKKAKKTLTFRRNLMIAAGVTIAAAGAYVAYKHYANYKTDTILKKGTLLQHIGEEGRDINDYLYTSYKKSDNETYIRDYTIEAINKGKSNVTKFSLETLDDIKIPSKKKRINEFMKLYDEDPKFRDSLKELGDYLSRNWVGNDLRKNPREKMFTKFDVYNDFNKYAFLISGDKKIEYARETYVNKLKQLGYNALVDENDVKKSGYRTKAPLIILGANKLLNKIDTKKVTADDVLSIKGNGFINNILQLNRIPNLEDTSIDKKSIFNFLNKPKKNKSSISLNDMAIAKNIGGIMDNIGLKDVDNYVKKGFGLDKAIEKAGIKQNVRYNAITVGSNILVGSLSYATVKKLSNDSLVNDYMKKNPNTDKTRKEIIDIQNKELKKKYNSMKY